MKNALAIAIALVLGLAGAVRAQDAEDAPPASPNIVKRKGGPVITALLFGEKRLSVEVADDPDEQRLGLMERKELGSDAGMLFVYSDLETREFWMKNTLIPLSIAFLDDKGMIVNILDMKELDTVPRYKSTGPARYAVETNLGWFAKNGIKAGDVVRFVYRRERIEGVAFGRAAVKVEVADTEATITRGLMHRTKLAEDAGMLFVFPYPQRLQFWMRNTPLPLAIAFLDPKKRVLNIEEMAALDDKTRHVSKGAAIWALEVNKGWYARQGVKPGDTARFLESSSEKVGPPGMEARDGAW